MAKRPTDFAQQNTERAIEVANYSLNWMREIAERNLSQSRAALEDLITITRKAGSFTFEESLAKAVQSGVLDRQDAMVRAAHPEELDSLLRAQSG